METTSFIQNVNILVDNLANILLVNDKFTQKDIDILSKYDYTKLQSIVLDLEKSDSSIKRVAEVIIELNAIYNNLDTLITVTDNVLALKSEILEISNTFINYLTVERDRLEKYIEDTTRLFTMYAGTVEHGVKQSASYQKLVEEIYEKIKKERNEIDSILSSVSIDYNKVKEARIWTEGCDDDVINIGGTHSAVTSAHLAKAFAIAPHGTAITEHLRRMGAMINAVTAWGLIEGNIDSQKDLYEKLTYSNNRAVPADVGQLKAGTTFINEPIKDILEKILYGE